MKGRGVLAAVCAAFLWMSTAEAARPAVSIRKLRETLPESWVGEYVIRHGDGKNLRDGDTVTIDVPIIVPEVEAVPAVRITVGRALCGAGRVRSRGRKYGESSGSRIFSGAG